VNGKIFCHSLEVRGGKPLTSEIIFEKIISHMKKKTYIAPKMETINIQLPVIMTNSVPYWSGEAGAPNGDFDFENIDEE